MPTYTQYPQVNSLNPTDLFLIDRANGVGTRGIEAQNLAIVSTAFGINIRDFGAVGNGTTDDTDAIQAAINAAANFGTFIYVPAGTYVISSELNNLNGMGCLGIVGDSPQTSVLKGDTLTGNAIRFVNPLPGTRLENFTVTGPGQTAPHVSSGISLTLDNTKDNYIGAVYLVNMTSVKASLFPTAGFRLVIPIVSTYTSCIAQECGTYGFLIDTYLSIYVGGTSTQWNTCYANNVKGTGYFFKSHVYSSMNSCAADTTNISYYFTQCAGIAMSGCGNEANTYISGAAPGIGIWMDQCFAGMTITSHWMYLLPNTASLPVKLVNCYGVQINGLENLPDVVSGGQQQTYDIVLDSACTACIITNCVNPLRTPGGVARVNNQAPNSYNWITTGSRLGVATFFTQDQYGNALYANGSVAIAPSAGMSHGGFAVYAPGNTNYAAAALSDFGGTPAVAFGNGNVVQDVIIGRGGEGQLSITAPSSITFTSNVVTFAANSIVASAPKFISSITVEGASSPGVGIHNTSTGKLWSVAGDNGGGMAFYDVTDAQTILYLYPTTHTTPGLAHFNFPVTTENKLTVVAGGITMRGNSKLLFNDYGNSCNGDAFLSGGRATVTNTLFNATSSRVLVTNQNSFGGPVGYYHIANAVDGSFDIVSSDPSDGSHVSYLMYDNSGV